jgi:hypothetical protein
MDNNSKRKNKSWAITRQTLPLCSLQNISTLLSPVNRNKQILWALRQNDSCVTLHCDYLLRETLRSEISMRVGHRISLGYIFCSVAHKTHSGPGRLIFEFPMSRTIRHTHSVGLLWKRDQLVAHTATRARAHTHTHTHTHTHNKQTQETNIYILCGFRNWSQQSKRLQTYTLERRTTSIGLNCIYFG